MPYPLLLLRSTTSKLVAATCIGFWLQASAALAAITSLPPGSLTKTLPDIMTILVDVTYTTDPDSAGTSTGTLRASITPDLQSLTELSGNQRNIWDSIFSVVVEIENGNAVSGTLDIEGMDDSFMDVLGLHSTVLSGFGHDFSAGIFEFIFDDVENENLPEFGSTVGIKLFANRLNLAPNGFLTGFTNNNGDPSSPLPGIADTFAVAAVPEPTSMIAWSIGSMMAGLIGWRRARRRV